MSHRPALRFGSAALLSLGLLACGGPSVASADTPAPRSIHVSGAATRLVVPDQARVEVMVEGRGETAAQAMAQAGERVAEILAAVRNLLEADGIRALQTDLRQVVAGTSRSWVRDRGEPLEILASRSLHFERVDMAVLPRLMDVLSSQKLAQVRGVTPQVRDARAIEDALQLEAIDDARARAEAMAQRLGVRLGLPLEVRVHSAQSPQPRMMMRAMASEAVMDSSYASAGYDSPGQEQLEARVDVQFELLPRNDR